MKWKIWPRQYGKTYQLQEWWLGDPAHRVILCGNRNLAQIRRHDLELRLPEVYPGTTKAEARSLTRNRIMSYRTWLGPTLPKKGDLRDCAVAVDDLDLVLPELLKAKVAYAAGMGTNDSPDFEIAHQVEVANAWVRSIFGDLVDE